jgi:hypothetical protein
MLRSRPMAGHVPCAGSAERDPGSRREGDAESDLRLDQHLSGAYASRASRAIFAFLPVQEIPSVRTC